MHIAIRVDGGPDIGYGHLVRTGAIAAEMAGRGHRITYATTTPDSVRQVTECGAEVVALESRDNPTPFVDWLRTAKPDTVLLDVYPAGTRYQQAVRAMSHLAVVSDDDRHMICADLLINGNLYAGDLEYEFAGNNPRQLLGSEYALLRKRLRELAEQSPPWREHPERALITMGGSDSAALTPTVLRAFDGHDLTIDAVIGPGFSDRLEHEVNRVATDLGSEVRVTRNPDDLPDRMFRADFAVCTASTTTYELLALGTPLIACRVVDNQRRIASSLRGHDAGTVIEHPDDERPLREAIDAYVANADLRRHRRNRGRELVDGKGTERTIAELISNRGANTRV